ncbi:MAG: S41 family peptidase [Phycisphaerae bacterium]|nr:S41 family peptidase [Phycisphaerae bacterium]
MPNRNRLYINIIVMCAVLTAINLVFAKSADLFDPLLDVADLVQKQYVTEVKEEDMVSGAINGMLHELDPYSEYIPAVDLAKFEKQLHGDYEGIGIGVDMQDGRLVVISPFEGSPAHKAGMRSGDIIIEVDGQSTKGWSITKATDHLTGKANTQVVVKVMHKEGTEETLSITRQKIHIPSTRGWRHNTVDGHWDYMLDEESKIGYIRVSQFVSDTVKEFDTVVKSLQEKQMKALILDLRSNPGGLLDAAVEMVDHLVSQGTIVSTRGAHSKEKKWEAKAEGTFPHFHLVVLVDQYSASASEVVSGALKDHNRAVIVGKRTWGKGSVQKVIRLNSSGDTVKLTTDHYYLPGGRCVHKLPGAETWGVEPDIIQSLDMKKLDALQELMGKLLDTVEIDKKVTPEQAREKDLLLSQQQAQSLFSLDDQLDQAVKQCKGQLRTRPGLESITEMVAE